MSLSTELPDVQPAAKLRDDVDQELQHVSFSFDTIELGSLIVCGLLALPHDLTPNQTQDGVYYACLAGAANPCVAAQDPRSSPLACLPEMAFSPLGFTRKSLLEFTGRHKEMPLVSYRESYRLRVLSHSSRGDNHARAPCDKIALVSILFLPKILVDAYCALKSNGVLGISLADFSAFVCKVSTRQKLKFEQVFS